MMLLSFLAHTRMCLSSCLHILIAASTLASFVMPSPYLTDEVPERKRNWLRTAFPTATSDMFAATVNRAAQPAVDIKPFALADTRYLLNDMRLALHDRNPDILTNWIEKLDEFSSELAHHNGYQSRITKRSTTSFIKMMMVT